MLQVAKVLNNNIAVVVNAQGHDCIAMGRGIVFGRKRGDTIDEADVERLFTQSVDELSGRFDQLVASIPEEYFEAAQAIVEHAKLRLGRELDDSIYLGLTDHIHFAVQRARKGQAIDNRLNFEIKMVYRDEFECALTTIGYLNRTFEVSLPEEEAGFIAMHFVNAETGIGMDGAVAMANIIQRALDIVQESLHAKLDEESIAYYRFMVHLKFFAQRFAMSRAVDRAEGIHDRQLISTVMREYPDSYDCAERIAEYVENTFRAVVPSDERVYLALHIERVRSGCRNGGEGKEDGSV